MSRGVGVKRFGRGGALCWRSGMCQSRACAFYGVTMIICVPGTGNHTLPLERRSYGIYATECMRLQTAAYPFARCLVYGIMITSTCIDFHQSNSALPLSWQVLCLSQSAPQTAGGCRCHQCHTVILARPLISCSRRPCTVSPVPSNASSWPFFLSPPRSNLLQAC